ncbi:SRPBCC family protein [Streptomyces sp. NPDC088354]|uniref:SRPBCC family protein n=1 Tax=Streptomyces sp. NPDC088354 TaxID=3365856 RepID=UPI003807372D
MTGEAPETPETLTTAADGRTALRMVRRLAHPPEKVWRALTEPGHLARWFPSDVEMELRPGGKVRFAFRHGEMPDLDGEVTEVDPPRVLAYTWGGDLLRWEVEPAASGSVLTLTHTFADRPGAASFASGWDTCIAGIDPALDGRPTPPPGDINAKHERFVAVFGLDQGTVEALEAGVPAADGEEGWRVRFERQLTQPAATVWRTLLGKVVAPEVGGTVPSGFATGEFGHGPVSEVRAPVLLAYAWDQDGRYGGTVRWELTEGTGHGARLILTHTGSAEFAGRRSAALDAWHDHVEDLARRLAEMPR